MTSIRIALSAVSLLLAGQALRAGSLNGAELVPCTTGTLATYTDPGGSNQGCALGVLVTSGWSLGSTGTTLTSSQILMTPTVSANGLGGGFDISAASGYSFGVASGQIASYFINFNYFIDPGPFLGDADLTLDPGNVTVTQFFCNDRVLMNAGPSPLCQSATGTPPVSPQTLQVTTASPQASIVFQPAALQFGSIETEIRLDGTNGPANFDDISSSLNVFASVPEPAAVALMAAGLLGIGIRRRYISSR
jgi:hypothetical protein